MQKQAEAGLQQAQQGLESAVNSIPPEAWPFIDIMFKITIALAIVWLFLSLIAWWRRRAYNLTIASTADRSKKAQPDFLEVDHDAREDAIARGERHEEAIIEREEAAAALKAAQAPLTWAQKFLSLATGLMSVFTLVAALSGTVANIGRMSADFQKLNAAGRLEYLLKEHTFGVLVAAFVVAYTIWQYFSQKQWKGV